MIISINFLNNLYIYAIFFNLVLFYYRNLQTFFQKRSLEKRVSFLLTLYDEITPHCGTIFYRSIISPIKPKLTKISIYKLHKI